MMKKRTPFTRFLIWRYKHISNKNFVYLLSILVGLIAGLSSVALKNITHYIAMFFEQGAVHDYHVYWYFIFPFLGLLLVLLVKKFILRFLNLVAHRHHRQTLLSCAPETQVHSPGTGCLSKIKYTLRFYRLSLVRTWTAAQDKTSSFHCF